MEVPQILWVQWMKVMVRRVWDAAALGARGAAAQVGSAGGPLRFVILSWPLHPQEPGNPLQQNELNLQSRNKRLE